MSTLKEKTTLYLRKRHRRMSVSGVSVRADWLFVLSCAAVAFVGFVVYAGAVYVGIMNGTAFETSEVETSSDADRLRDEVSQAVEYLGTR